jgi:hypothetical protein
VSDGDIFVNGTDPGPNVHNWYANVSVAAAKKTAFLGNWYSVGNKMSQIIKIFDSVEHPKNQGVTYWVKINMPLVV